MQMSVPSLESKLEYMAIRLAQQICSLIISVQLILKARVFDSHYRLLVERHTTRVETLIVATIYLQLIQNRYMFRSFTVLHCSHQHCVQPVASDVEFVRYL